MSHYLIRCFALLWVFSVAPACAEGADETAIRAVMADVFAAYNAGDASAMAPHMHEDIVVRARYGDLRSGRETVLQNYRAMFASFDVTLQADLEEVLVLSDTAYVVLTYTLALTPKQGGETLQRTGRANSVFVRAPAAPKGWVWIREMAQAGP